MWLISVGNRPPNIEPGSYSTRNSRPLYIRVVSVPLNICKPKAYIRSPTPTVSKSERRGGGGPFMASRLSKIGSHVSPSTSIRQSDWTVESSQECYSNRCLSAWKHTSAMRKNSCLLNFKIQTGWLESTWSSAESQRLHLFCSSLFQIYWALLGGVLNIS